MRGIKTGWKAKPLTQLTGQFNILPGRLVKAIKRFWCLTPNSHHNPLLPPHTWTHWERKRGGVFTLWQQLRVFQASHQIETVGWLPIAALVPLETPSTSPLPCQTLPRLWFYSSHPDNTVCPAAKSIRSLCEMRENFLLTVSCPPLICASSLIHSLISLYLPRGGSR